MPGTVQEDEPERWAPKGSHHALLSLSCEATALEP